MVWLLYIKGRYNQGYLALIKMNNKYVVEYKRKIDNKNMSMKFGPEINS